MSFWSKLGHIITIFFMGFEAQKSLNDNEKDERVIVHTSEIKIEKSEDKNDNFTDSEIILYLLIAILSIAVIVKIYKKIVKDVSHSITST